ncbi:MAG: hypothetical protein M0027_03600 [Candidatus Dormibacteraeota bacterium]|nr:hypothetical protein [Candidatus Dormibacteraeota bacterium]
MISYLVWFPGEATLGYFFNDFVLKLTPIVTVATPGLLLAIVLAAFAHDIQRQTDSPEAAHA